MNNIRVLVVDDSSLMRRSISKILESAPDITVIATASNGQEAVELARKLRPDVITMDVIMPVMDGLAALKEIVKQTGSRVIMLSSETYEGSKQTIEALSAGAVDYITKTSGQVSLDIGKISNQLINKVRTAHKSKTMVFEPISSAGYKFRQIVAELSSREKPSIRENLLDPLTSPVKREIVAIASSTGGPAALQVVLSALPRDLPAGIVIVQHLTEGFSQTLADKLDSVSSLDVRLCSGMDDVKPGVALLAPAGCHVTIKRMGERLLAVLGPDPENSLHKPSADVMFSSVAHTCANRSCAVILTGMGDDGAQGIKEIKERGGVTIAQNEATSVIFGMPKAAIEKGAIKIVAPLGEIAARIMAALITDKVPEPPNRPNLAWL